MNIHYSLFLRKACFVYYGVTLMQCKFCKCDAVCNAKGSKHISRQRIFFPLWIKMWFTIESFKQMGTKAFTLK